MFTRHPRNTSFHWEMPKPPYRALSTRQAREYDETGAFLLEAAFTAAEMDEVSDAIAPFEKATEDALRKLEGGRYLIAKADAITFTTHLVGKSEALRRFSRHPVFQDLCHDLMGPNARLYWDQAVYKKPGNPEEFPWHQDNGYTYVEPQQYLTCWVALNDATEENGCPWVVPGLHRNGTLVHETTPLGYQCLRNPQGAVAMPARKGDIVVFSSLTPHRTGPNLSQGVRQAYILQYAPEGALAFPPGASEGIAQEDPSRQYHVDTH